METRIKLTVALSLLLILFSATIILSCTQKVVAEFPGAEAAFGR